MESFAVTMNYTVFFLFHAFRAMIDTTVDSIRSSKDCLLQEANRTSVGLRFEICILFQMVVSLTMSRSLIAS
jgi:hypothetical protein